MLFTVNTEVCTRCGLCVADCPTGLLVMSDDGPITGNPVGQSATQRPHRVQTSVLTVNNI